MDVNWDTSYIEPGNLIAIARGDNNRLEKYLRQFQELIPERIERLQESLVAEDRKMVRQILHQMSPQLEFFGVPEVIPPIRRLEYEYETIPLEELKTLVQKILVQLDGACDEVKKILNDFE
jgi:HPt (histidine-containing phosphotransfer) domain-containing protein